MGIISHTLQQLATIIQTRANAYGDQIFTSSGEYPCRFRYVTELDRNVNREGLETADAIIWFESTAPIKEGTIVSVDGYYWRVDRLIKARKLSGNTVEFLKALVKRHSLADAS
jgi:hypothetical protein